MGRQILLPRPHLQLDRLIREQVHEALPILTLDQVRVLGRLGAKFCLCAIEQRKKKRSPSTNLYCMDIIHTNLYQLSRSLSVVLFLLRTCDEFPIVDSL